MLSKNVKLVVYVPVTHGDQVRAALAKAGAGKIGNYSNCSFSCRGQGRFQPERGASPAIGAVGSLEIVDEERIEVLVPRTILGSVIAQMKQSHPYEEVAFDVVALEDVV